MKKTVYNKKLRPFIHEWSIHWQPAIPEVQTLWPTMINESRYVHGYWVENNMEMLAVLHLIDGDAFLLFDDKKYLIHSGETVLIPFGYRKLMTGPSGKCVKRVIGLQGLALKMFIKLFHLDELRILPHFDQKKFDEIFSRFAELLTEKNPAKAGEITLLVHTFLLQLNENKTPQYLPKQLQKAIHFFEQNLGTVIYLSDAAKISRCSLKMLETLFKHHLGMPPLAYLKKLRLDYACILLEGQTLRIKEIAELCGYANQLYFTNDFRRHMGCSPTSYRKKYQK